MQTITYPEDRSTYRMTDIDYIMMFGRDPADDLRKHVAISIEGRQYFVSEVYTSTYKNGTVELTERRAK